MAVRMHWSSETFPSGKNRLMPCAVLKSGIQMPEPFPSVGYKKIRGRIMIVSYRFSIAENRFYVVKRLTLFHERFDRLKSK